MSTITVTHLDEDSFRIDVRGHHLLVDQLGPDNEDVGPNPTELFVASLTACVGHYAARFLRRHGLPHTGLRVDCDWLMLAARPARVGRVRLRVSTPEPVPEELRATMGAALEQCTVQNSLRHPPQVSISLADVAVPAN